jgi:long-chain acyl-CoA synthetase
MADSETIPQLIKSNCEKWGQRTAMSMKHRGIWRRYSWKEYYENVKYFSLGLISLGFKPRDVVCIIGDNEPEWFWGEFAAQAAGGIATGIFVDAIPSEVKYVAAHCGAKFAIVNDQEQTDKFLEIKDELPSLKKVIYWDPKGLKNYLEGHTPPFEEFLEQICNKLLSCKDSVNLTITSEQISKLNRIKEKYVVQSKKIADYGEISKELSEFVPIFEKMKSQNVEGKGPDGHIYKKIDFVEDEKKQDEVIDEAIFFIKEGLSRTAFLINFNEVIDRGREYEKKHPKSFEQNVKKGKGSDVAFIYYTSGTTGLPKGAVITHKALINTSRGFVDRFPFTGNDDLVSNFPPAWVGDSFFATVPHLLTGARINFPEEPETIAEDTREVGPDFVIYGPRQWESLVSEIQVKITDANPIKRLFYHLFMPVGYKMADLSFEGKTPDLFWRALHGIAYGLLFRPLKDRLGLVKARLAVTGSSVLSLDTFRLIHAIGIELRQNYASTEAGFISSHGKGEIDFQSVGRPATGVEVRVTDEGELLVRSECLFKEYFKDPEKTEAVVVNGWCRTGDAVNINDQGHLIFMDRVEHMGELASGTKYAPQYIEGRLRFSPYIKDAMVVGGKERDFVGAIVNIDFAMVGKWAERHGLPYTTFVDLSQKKEVADLVQKDLIRVNGYLPQGSRVRKFVLLHKEFDADEAELTRTRKLRRDFVEQRYKDLIEAMYGDKKNVTVEAPVTYRDGRHGVVSTAVNVRQVN